MVHTWHAVSLRLTTALAHKSSVEPRGALGTGPPVQKRTWFRNQPSSHLWATYQATWTELFIKYSLNSDSQVSESEGKGPHVFACFASVEPHQRATSEVSSNPCRYACTHIDSAVLAEFTQETTTAPAARGGPQGGGSKQRRARRGQGGRSLCPPLPRMALRLCRRAADKQRISRDRDSFAMLAPVSKAWGFLAWGPS